MDTTHHHNEVEGEVAKPQTKAIWKTFWILFALTAVEFVIAFSMHHSMLRVSIFVIMTFVKAFFIVGEFMHLKHEVKTLIWTIILPAIFVVWLVVALLQEGAATFNAIYR